MFLTEANPNELSDLALVEAVQRGDLQAFGSLMDRHLDHVHAFISMKLPVAHLVDELTHETLVFAFRHIHEFTNGTAFRAWLRAIASNKIRAEVERYCREERNRLSYGERRLLDISISQTDLADSRELDALHDCLRKIPEKMRALLTLKYQDESSTAEIAHRLERSLAWVRTTLCRLRQQLKECVENKLKATPS